MLRMYLNNDGKSIDVTSYSRSLDVPNPDVRFRLNLNFTGDYSATGVEHLADFADSLITQIKIVDANNTTLLNSTNAKAKLESLNETCDENGRYGYATIIMYEASAQI